MSFDPICMKIISSGSPSYQLSTAHLIHTTISIIYGVASIIKFSSSCSVERPLMRKIIKMYNYRIFAEIARCQSCPKLTWCLPIYYYNIRSKSTGWAPNVDDSLCLRVIDIKQVCLGWMIALFCLLVGGGTCKCTSNDRWQHLMGAHWRAWWMMYEEGVAHCHRSLPPQRRRDVYNIYIHLILE